MLGQSGTAARNTLLKENIRKPASPPLGPDPRPLSRRLSPPLRNIPALEQAAAGRGLFSIQPEPDGIVRRVPIVMKADDKIVPALTLELLRVATGSSAILVRTDEAGVEQRCRTGSELPTDRNGPHLGALHAAQQGALRLGQGHPGGQRRAGAVCRQARAFGTSAIGLLDVKTTPARPPCRAWKCMRSSWRRR